MKSNGQAVAGAIIEAVEKQLREGKPPVARETLSRLVSGGMTREEAVARIARVLGAEMFHVMQEERPFDGERYAAKLCHLGTTDYQDFSMEELVDLLFSEEDTLSRKVVNEFVRRGDACVEELKRIIEDEEWWGLDAGGWWSVVHAVHILGAIGGEHACAPLVKAIVLSHQYDVDWLYEVLPSIIGSLPVRVADQLKQIAESSFLNWFPRVKAAESLAALASRNASIAENAFTFLGRMFIGEEDLDVKGHVGCILMDFHREEYRETLLEHGRSVRHGIGVVFTDEDVQQAFSEKSSKQIRSQYRQDWLEFYSPKNIACRQKRWAEEAAREQDDECKREQNQRHPTQSELKVSRNDPCPCGSGKKYKKCCLEEVR